MEIRGFSVEYSSRLKKEKNNEFNILNNEYKTIDNLLNLPLDNINLQQQNDRVKIRIEEHLKYQAEGTAAKAIHSLDGKRATNYFSAHLRKIILQKIHFYIKEGWRHSY